MVFSSPPSGPDGEAAVWLLLDLDQGKEAERLPAHDERQPGTSFGFEIDGRSNQFDEEVVSLPKPQAYISTSQSLKLLDPRLLARGEQALRKDESNLFIAIIFSKHTRVPKMW